jgi:hypothetical protein
VRVAVLLVELWLWQRVRARAELAELSLRLLAVLALVRLTVAL